jgi:hypothetical protein
MLIKSHKLWTIIFLCLSLTALILLSAGITGLDLTYGKPFSIRSDAEPGAVGFQRPTFGEGYFNIIFALFLISLLLFPIAIYFIFSSKEKKHIIRILLPLLWLAILYILIQADLPPLVEPESGFQETVIADEAPLTDVESIYTEPANTEVEFTYAPPHWLVITMTTGIAILISTLLVSVFIYIRRLTRRRLSPLQQLAKEAQDAIDALKAGSDLANTIIRCYYEMNRVLLEQRGFKRDKAMTPREFERDLVGVGLPSEQVRKLTRLFESVRYGTKVSDEEEERQAIESLSLIVNAIKGSP